MIRPLCRVCRAYCRLSLKLSLTLRNCCLFIFCYFSCRSDPDDELENSEFIGINTYQHCDGTLTSSDPLVGFENLLADFASYGTTVPVIVSERWRMKDCFLSR
jgi:hypothetical protein